ncbi:MAG: radical SAM protein [Candidatus Omnitrophica bacterium]|nr:radical SAM protein [Candidatus Omnitrophota bacterium]
MVFFISFRCNLRCAMCYAWVKQKQIKELSIEEIAKIFDDKLLINNLEIINITGGEPTLRDDLGQIVKIILQKCIRLKRIDISTNGVNTAQAVDQIERILALLLPTDVKLTASISLDGVGKAHERIRGAGGIFVKIEETIDELKKLMSLYPFFSLGFNMTISKLNYSAIEEVKRYALQKGIGVNFTLAAISDIGVESAKVRKEFEMNQDEKNKVVVSLEDLSRANMINQRYAQFLLTWLRKQRRSGGCAFKAAKAFLVEPDGATYLCGNFKEAGVGNISKEPLECMLKRSRSVLRSIPKNCASCVSNCYWDQV